MIGRRIFPDAEGCFPALQPGDYMLAKRATPYEAALLLYWPPGAELGPWRAHPDKKITEHDDGTLSVTPSILCVYAKLEPGRPGSWHGFLDKGIWRKC